MRFIDAKYINLLSSRLGKFSKKKEGLYNFRCPYCGDSSKNKNKARGYIYRYKNDHNFKCHNCGASKSFTYFLKDVDTSLYKEYVLERYKEGLTGKGTVAPNPEFKFEKPNFTKPLFDLPTIQKLNTSHPAKEYLSNRKIPEEFFSQLYFAENFNEWAGTSNTQKESRIIIPLLSKSKKLFGYQARSLDPNAKLRYLTNILDSRYPKLFGLDRIDHDKQILITEGPFDSMFLDNALAMCGADVTLDKDIYPNRVFIFDNEPRNLEIVKRYEKMIDSGESVVIWPKDVTQKDINDMILSNKNVKQVIQCNIYGGLEAKVKLYQWKKV
ncbi:MAG: DNA primase [Candidatus Nanopelagicales bacterium]|nr:DNA primase [Synechococcus phage DSL-LC03]